MRILALTEGSGLAECCPPLIREQVFYPIAGVDL
jgi:hypothetical protein